jgi:hypothetical protein
MSNQPPEAEPKLTAQTKNIRASPEMIPKDFPSVHVDKAMVGVDEGIDTATLTLLSMHVVPNLEQGRWTLDNVRWEVVAEVKIPIPALNAVAIYYIEQVTGGLNILPVIQKYLREHPKEPPKTGITYGPTEIHQEPQKRESTGIQP